LITGASAGLGKDLAALFAADGYDLVLVARRRERLEALAAELTAAHGVTVTVLAQDLGAAGAAEAIHAAVQEAGLTVTCLVNNAGFGSNGRFWELAGEREAEMVQVNIMALVQLTHLFLPAMVARGAGRILNIGSTAGFQAGPHMATYYASKAFVNHFTEALAVELEGTGVTATVACPGPVATEFGAVAGNDKSNLFRSGAAASMDVARFAYEAMKAGRSLVVHGVMNKLATQGNRLMPRSVVQRIAAKLNARAD